MSRFINIIPNFLTFSNTFLGFYSIHFSFLRDFQSAGACIFVGVVCDFLDGKTARMLKVNTSLGKELDSFADFLTFGIAPALLVSNMLNNLFLKHHFTYLLLYTFTFFYAFLSAVRLAIFNSETDYYSSVKKIRENDYIGIPSTFSGGIISFFAAYALWPKGIFNILPVAFISHPYFMLILLSVLSLIMVAPIPYPKGFGMIGSFKRYPVLNIFFLIVFILIGRVLVLLMIIDYILRPLISYYFFSKKSNI